MSAFGPQVRHLRAVPPEDQRWRWVCPGCGVEVVSAEVIPTWEIPFIHNECGWKP